MDMKPRKLPVFDPLTPDTCAETPHPALRSIALDSHIGKAIEHPGLGRSGKAIELPKGEAVSFDLGKLKGDSVTIVLSFLPNHPIVDGEGLKVAVSLDGSGEQTADYSTQGRSEEWKENILNMRAQRRFTFPLKGRKAHSLSITARTEGVILDEVEI